MRAVQQRPSRLSGHGDKALTFVKWLIFAAICGLMGLFPNGVLSVMQSIAGAIA